MSMEKDLYKESDMGDTNMEWDDITICANCKFKPNRPHAFICSKYDNVEEMNKAIFADECEHYETK